MTECLYAKECKEKVEKYSPQSTQKEIDGEVAVVRIGPWFKCYGFTKEGFLKHLKELGYENPEELSCFDGKILGKLALDP